MAEVTEHWTQVLDEVLRPMSNTIHKRMNNAATNAAFGEIYYNGYLLSVFP